jgi:hypothetical protein
MPDCSCHPSEQDGLFPDIADTPEPEQFLQFGSS